MYPMCMCVQVSYHDVPAKAYETFVFALTSRFLKQNRVIPLLNDQNPAGQISSLKLGHAAFKA